MTAYDYRPGPPAYGMPAPRLWVRALLGVILILAGLFIVGDVVRVARISAIVIGAVAVAAGAFEIVHAFWTKGWGGFLWQLVLGALYVAFGIVLLTQPASGALILTYAFGLLLLASGILRILLGLSYSRAVGWIMLLSGAFGVLAGLVILTGIPQTSEWLLGLLLGIDFIGHGVAWLAYAWMPAARMPH